MTKPLITLPPAVWNVVGLLSGATFGYAASVAWHDEAGDAVVRGAVAVSGLIVAEAMRRGGVWHVLWRMATRFADRFGSRFLLTKRFEFCVIVSIVSIVFAVLYPLFDTARREADGGQSLGRLKSCGLALLQYASDYDDTLPPRMHTNAVPVYLMPHLKNTEYLYDNRGNRAFTWRRQFGGLTTDDLLETSQLVVAYSPYLPPKKKRRSV